MDGADWRKDFQARIDAGMARGGRWLVGVSGGSDSVALLRLLLALGYGKRLVIGHFNHRWSAWGDEAQSFVQALARKHKLAIELGEGSGKAATNAEAKGRDERREWMYARCADLRLDGMILAHTRTDVVETFFMRAGKGSGVTGLSGMQETLGVVGKRTWRPLLGVGRAELREYLRHLGQEWLEDPDNEAGGSQRARVRKLLPALEDVGVGEVGVAACVEALRRAEEALWQVTDTFWREHVDDRLGLAVDRIALLAVPMEIRLRVVERVLRLGDAKEDGLVARTGKRIDLLERIASKDKGAATLGGVKFVWDMASVRAIKEHV